MSIILYDLETASVEGGICELGYLEIKNKEKQFNVHRFNPGRLISYDAMGVHFITNEMVQDKPEFRNSKEYKIFQEKLNQPKTILVGFNNMSFDDKILQQEKITLPEYIIDLYKITKYIKNEEIKQNKLDVLWPENLKLTTLFFYYEGNKVDIKSDKYNWLKTKTLIPHQAETDIFMLYYIMAVIMKKYKYTISDLIRITKEPIMYDRLLFGKYEYSKSGLLLEEIIRKDSNYIDWCLKNLDDPDIIESINYYKIH